MKSSLTRAILGLSIFLIGQSVAVEQAQAQRHQPPRPFTFPDCDAGYQKDVEAAGRGFDKKDSFNAMDQCYKALDPAKDTMKVALRKECAKYCKDKECNSYRFSLTWDDTLGLARDPDYTHLCIEYGKQSCSCPVNQLRGS
jgi:hypothetical protein